MRKGVVEVERTKETNFLLVTTAIVIVHYGEDRGSDKVGYWVIGFV